ncbi:efflux RND transporter periplasmic adaptor subunit [Desulfosporosinus fructosivorans]|uniref:Efflux RND transporter periplasmic adaptor subunit n=1 Tax=Desulfosporosinus fructosivorans TaxID=2018669 RepID=A0A4Z0RA53_9FIRM|nr:efflux RND transporter periplasmic adaptor subunit [Desulfosporosinus fructosivorans]TGE38496.1 efflux RND transporter periplasmic adaptor subunit [Desulfosporosinus fructosivorans]
MKRAMLISLAMVMVLTGCSASAQKEEQASTEVQASKQVYVMAGIIDANEKAEITTKISAKITGISVDVGTVVKKGDTLISLDSKDIEAQITQAQAGVNTAEANLAKMQSGARPEQIAQAQATVDSAKTSYLNVKNTYERNQQLLVAGGISQSQMESSETQLAVAQAQYNSAQSQLDILTKGETQETINIAQAQVQQAQAALDLVKTQLAYGTITSPVSGIVSAKNINVGELASPGVILVSVVNVDSLYIKASLPEGHMKSVKVGQAVIVKVTEIPDKEFPGEVSFMDSVIDSRSRSVLVKINLNNPDSILKPGMLAEIGLKN